MWNMLFHWPSFVCKNASDSATITLAPRKAWINPTVTKCTIQALVSHKLGSARLLLQDNIFYLQNVWVTIAVPVWGGWFGTDIYTACCKGKESIGGVHWCFIANAWSGACTLKHQGFIMHRKWTNFIVSFSWCLKTGATLSPFSCMQ